jgi:hypothetical protein
MKYLKILGFLSIAYSSGIAYASTSGTQPFPSDEDAHASLRRLPTFSGVQTTTFAASSGSGLNADPLSRSVIANARTAGLDAPHIVRMRQMLADEHTSEVEDVICTRWCFRKCANWNEAIGNTAGYLAMAATPLAGAVMLVPAAAVASPYIVLAGSVAAGVKLFCMGLASCSAREADERHQTLDSLAGVIGVHPVDITPTVTGPDENAAANSDRTEATAEHE